MQALWLIPLLPFLGALLNGVVLKDRASKKLVTSIAVGSVGLTTVLALFYVIPATSERRVCRRTWLRAGALRLDTGRSPEAHDGVFAELTIDFGFLLDPLSAVMLFVVTFVGFWIHVYSIGYMGHEEGYQRYFAYLNLFMGAMLLLVLGNNFLVMFVGWEGVGLCSYLLIGFYYGGAFLPTPGVRPSSSTGSVTLGFCWPVCSGVDLRQLALHARSFPQAAARSRHCRVAICLGLTLASFVRSACLSEPPVRARRFRSTSGCPTRWRARRRSRP